MRTAPFQNLYPTAVGEQLCRLFCLFIARTCQDVLIENVAFGREDEQPVLFRGYVITSAAKPPSE